MFVKLEPANFSLNTQEGTQLEHKLVTQPAEDNRYLSKLFNILI